MKAILSKIANVLDAYELERGCRPRQINLPLHDAEDLAAIESCGEEGETPDDTVDDRDEQDTMLEAEALDGMEMFGATIHVDKAASVITCG
jgi:hypothetical protein